MDSIQVFLVDDHQIVRDGIKSLLKDEKNVQVIGEAESCYQLFEQLKTLTPDIVILDISLPNMSGIEVAKTLSKDYPSVKILMLSMYTNEDFIFNSIKAGAKGYLPKNTEKNELLTALHEIYAGREYYSQSIADIMHRTYIRKARHGKDINDRKEGELTPRELEILKHIAEGRNNAEIAKELFISVRTVETHRNHIMQKLDLNSTVDLVKYAIRNKIIEL